MKTSKNMTITRFVVYVLLLGMITGCEYGQKKPKNHDIEFMAEYYGEPYDSLAKFIVFQDTTIIYNAGLTISHFYDHRNTRRNAKDSLYFGLSKLGIFVKNTATGQQYVYSKNLPGFFMRGHTSQDSFYSPIANRAEGTFVQDEYFNTHFRDDTFVIYRLQQTGISMKLSGILNDLPKKTKLNLSRTLLDSVFQAFFFYPYQKSDSNLTILFKGSDTSYFNFRLAFLDNIDDHTTAQQLSLAKAYAKELSNTLSQNNLFVYAMGSRFVNGDAVIVIINENMTRKEIGGPNKFYMEYDDEPMLYDINVYSVY